LVGEAAWWNGRRHHVVERRIASVASREETGWRHPDPGGGGADTQGKLADRDGRTCGFGLPNARMIWPGAEIDERGGRPWEIEGIPPGFWIPKMGLN
jgi:hypothetical protein